MAIVLYTTKEAAAYLKCSHAKLCKNRMKGLPPKYVKNGNAVLYRKSDLDKLIRDNVRTSTKEE